MGSYLDAYASAGQQSERRGRIVKRVAVTVLTAAVIVTAAYFGLRTWNQEHVVNQFLEDLKRKDYQSAYKLWGCTPETPCKDYPSDKFNEDWGSGQPVFECGDYKGRAHRLLRYGRRVQPELSQAGRVWGCGWTAPPM